MATSSMNTATSSMNMAQFHPPEIMITDNFLKHYTKAFETAAS